MAEDGARGGREGLTGREVKMMVLLVVGGIVVGLVGGLLTFPHYPEIAKLFWGAAITLFYGALLGGVVKLLLENFDRRRTQRAAQMDFISNVLSDLKGVYDSVDRSKTLIAAKQSAKAYGEEMLNLIAARVDLKNVKRALETDERGAPIESVQEHVDCMEAYLGQLLKEYKKEYKQLSFEQNSFEAEIKNGKVVEGQKNPPWDHLSSLPQMKDFLAATEDTSTPASGFRTQFLDSLDMASKALRKALANQLRQSR